MSADTSTLCRACGLCCNGVLHARVEVEPEAVPVMATLGVTIETFADRSVGFRQPCVLHRGDCCRAYDQRPARCRDYQCALLEKYAAGEVGEDDALGVVRATKALVLTGEERALLEARPDLALQAAALDVMLKKHFRRQPSDKP